MSLLMAKRVAVTGASGLLGRELVKKFAADQWDCLGLAYSRARDKLLKVRMTICTCKLNMWPCDFDLRPQYRKPTAHILQQPHCLVGQ